jgi:hypothetical protein
METSLRTLQIVRIAMLVSIVIYGFFAGLLPSSATPNPVIFYAITLMAVVLVAMMSVMRRMYVLRSEPVLAAQPNDAKALTRWRTGYLIRFCLSEAIALYGLALHFLGFSIPHVAPFYLVGFVLLLFFAPRRPSNEIG